MKQILFLLSSFAVAPLALLASEKISEPTMSNLQTAFNGESNAHARYLAFAVKADAEGYAGVASLFRAAARAEEIHAGNHAAVIKDFGGIPVAKLEDPGVKSTRENLEAALKGGNLRARRDVSRIPQPSHQRRQRGSSADLSLCARGGGRTCQALCRRPGRSGKHEGRPCILRLPNLRFYDAESGCRAVSNLRDSQREFREGELGRRLC